MIIYRVYVSVVYVHYFVYIAIFSLSPNLYSGGIWLRHEWFGHAGSFLEIKARKKKQRALRDVYYGSGWEIHQQP